MSGPFDSFKRYEELMAGSRFLETTKRYEELMAGSRFLETTKRYQELMAGSRFLETTKRYQELMAGPKFLETTKRYQELMAGPKFLETTKRYEAMLASPQLTGVLKQYKDLLANPQLAQAARQFESLLATPEQAYFGVPDGDPSGAGDAQRGATAHGGGLADTAIEADRQLFVAVLLRAVSSISSDARSTQALNYTLFAYAVLQTLVETPKEADIGAVFLMAVSLLLDHWTRSNAESE